MQKQIRIKITGRVQGVFFRKYTVMKAAELGLTGFVKNMPDNSVLIEAAGNDEELSLFVDWCYSGSPQAQVANVVVMELHHPLNYSSFEIG